MTKRGSGSAARTRRSPRARARTSDDRGTLTCSIRGSGLDVDVRVGDVARLTNLARTLMSMLGDGVVLMKGSSHAPHAPQSPSESSGQLADYDPALLRRTVAEDLRQMWEAMWRDGPAHVEDLESRDARFAAWVASPAGRAIIDDALYGGLVDHKLRQN